MPEAGKKGPVDCNKIVCIALVFVCFFLLQYWKCASGGGIVFYTNETPVVQTLSTSKCCSYF